ncbi:MAG: TraR/DksA family transcriptional regulator [Gemmatimonadetes bacterium]|nr:TraR/DksA family transcriptional regulator [Gemmatimonadota bacterium]MYK41943.1 TraR/DksA family transcriptional regulator [Gemmatimonadota bacterium]
MNDQSKQMDQKDLDFFKKLLLEKIAQTSDDVEAIENTSRNDARETASEDRSTYSLHMADHGTDAMEREKSLLLAQRGGDYIDYLNEALQRIEDGTFGICRTCKGPIGRGRLEAVPTATQCISCKSKREGASDLE